MTETKPRYHVASFSGGKDSTAMVLRLIELAEPLDEVVYCDTTVEFPAMYRHIEKVKQAIEAVGIKFTTLRAEHDFEYYLTETDVPNRKKTSDYYGVPGYGWPSHKNRWCTGRLKTELIDAYIKSLREQFDVIQYIGLAADEDYRLEREINRREGIIHPLRKWGWTEEDAMNYCKGKGYNWEGLYELFYNEKTQRSRVSCYLCPLKSYDDLRTLRRQFPDLWHEMLRLDAKQWQDFAHGYRIPDLDRRFALEDALTAEGHSIKNKQFFADLKRLLAEEATIEKIINERKGVNT